MLGLRPQVPGDDLGVRGGVGEHDQLARAGQRLDPDLAEQQALGLLDVGVAGADDQVDGADALGAERHRGNRLRTADRIDLLDAQQVQRGQHRAVGEPVRARRRADCDGVDPGDLGRYDAHDGAGRVRSAAARHVQPDAADGHLAGGHDLAVGHHLAGGGRHRGARRLPQVGGQQLDRVAHRRGDQPQGGLQLGLWHARIFDVDAVEPAGQAPHRLVAALAHHPDHIGDGSAHLIAVLPGGPQAADGAVNVR